MAIWVIITCSLINLNYEDRRRSYNIGIETVIKKFKDPKYKIVIVENNSSVNSIFSATHKTFLNEFGIPVLYTTSNKYIKQTKNYGIMEMMDVYKCIEHFGIQDDDFVVKITGRYILDLVNCPFFDVVDKLETTPYTAVVRSGSYFNPVVMGKNEVITTGLIGLQCKYVKQIEIPDLNDWATSIEHNWAKVISKLDDKEICFLEKLGLFFKPGYLKDSRYYYI